MPMQADGLRKVLGFEARGSSICARRLQTEGCHLFVSQCGCGHRSAQITYSDGLSVVSVFESPMKAACAAGDAICPAVPGDV